MAGIAARNQHRRRADQERAFHPQAGDGATSRPARRDHGGNSRRLSLPDSLGPWSRRGRRQPPITSASARSEEKRPPGHGMARPNEERSPTTMTLGPHEVPRFGVRPGCPVGMRGDHAREVRKGTTSPSCHPPATECGNLRQERTEAPAAALRKRAAEERAVSRSSRPAPHLKDRSLHHDRGGMPGGPERKRGGVLGKARCLEGVA